MSFAPDLLRRARELLLKNDEREEPAKAPQGAPTRLYFMMHGKSVACESGLCSGSGSECKGLTDAGREEMRRAAFKLKRLGPQITIYTSPLRRCAESAEIVAETLGSRQPPVTEKALVERNYGKWEGLPAGDHLPLALKGETPPGGESADEIRKRIKKFISRLPEDAGDVLLMSHPGVWKALIDVYAIDRKPWLQNANVFALDLPKRTAHKL